MRKVRAEWASETAGTQIQSIGCTLECNARVYPKTCRWILGSEDRESPTAVGETAGLTQRSSGFSTGCGNYSGTVCSTVLACNGSNFRGRCWESVESEVLAQTATRNAK